MDKFKLKIKELRDSNKIDEVKELELEMMQSLTVILQRLANG